MSIEIRQASAEDIPLLEGFIRAYHDFEGVVHPEPALTSEELRFDERKESGEVAGRDVTKTD